MEDKVINFISQYISLSNEEIEIIHEEKLIRFFKKNTLLLSQGDFAKECYFLLNGCVRAYYLIEGEERSTEFYTENETITPVSYVKKEASEYFLSCLEDCVIAVGSPERNKSLLEKIPKLESMIIQMNSELLVQKQISFDNFKNLNPEMRYLKLLETRPDLIERVPQFHLATYLGITPVSLSRLRKRILTKIH